MSIIVEDGTGLATAESFCTLQFVKDYHLALGFTWVATDQDTEAAMRRAVAYMVGKWAGRWVGCQKTQEQALPWPRVWAYSIEEFLLDDDNVPIEAQQCEAELTRWALVEDLMPDQTNPGTLESKSVKVGPVEKSTTWIGGQSTEKKYAKAFALARQITNETGRVYRA